MTNKGEAPLGVSAPDGAIGGTLFTENDSAPEAKGQSGVFTHLKCY
jgi:hypothetical protein